MNPQDPLQQNPQVINPQPAEQPPTAQNPAVVPAQPSTPQTPPTPPKKRSPLVVVVIVLVIILLLVIVLAAVLNRQPKQNSQTGVVEFSKTYDSPAGLASGMQAQEVRSGSFKLTASYVTGSTFSREGSFVVTEDGNTQFELVTDDVRVNRLLQQLYVRSGSKRAYSTALDGTTKFQTFSFSDSLGYQALYDTKGKAGQSGFIPEIELAKKTPARNPRYTLTSSCDAALADVKEKTNLTTTNLTFEQSNDGIQKRQAKIAFSSLQAADTAVATFLSACYDQSLPANKPVKAYADELQQDVTASPTFTFWQENGVDVVEVSAPPSDTPFGGLLRFELSKLSTQAKQSNASVGSYVERRNQFGLTFSLCRVDPVVTATTELGYRFLYDDPAYRYPNANDTGYYCSTLVVPSQFAKLNQMTLKNTTGKSVVIPGSGIDALRGFHDLTYEVEQYNLQNKRYPGPTEFRDIATTNLRDLTAMTQQIFTNKTLQYTPTPAGCVGTCEDFVLSYNPQPDVQVRRSAYEQ